MIPSLYLWDKQVFLDKLKNKTFSTFQMYFFASVSPFLTIIISFLFTVLLYFYRFVAVFFVDLIDTVDSMYSTCYSFFLAMSGLTMFITLGGFIWCCIINGRGDAKHFFIRMSCLSLWITIHLLIFILALCSLFGIFGIFVLYKKVIAFHAQIQATGIATAIIPFFMKTILAPLVGFQTAKMPPLVINFFENARTALFFAYFIIGAIPPVLTFVYYYTLVRMLKVVSKHP